MLSLFNAWTLWFLPAKFQVMYTEVCPNIYSIMCNIFNEIIVLGGSNFRMNSTTTASLRNSECTSMPIVEDKSSYWYPVS